MSMSGMFVAVHISGMSVAVSIRGMSEAVSGMSATAHIYVK